MNKNIQDAFEKTRRAGSIAAGALDEVCKIIKPGLSTNKIDKVCFEYINDNGAYSAPLFYRGFPKSCCTSPNHTVCHGIPSDRILRDGDSRYNNLALQVTLNDSAYSDLSFGSAFIKQVSGGNSTAQVNTQALIDVTDTSNVKMRFQFNTLQDNQD